MQKSDIQNITSELLDLKISRDDFYTEIEMMHLKAIRPVCVSLAKIGLGIIQDAQDTVWVTPFETAIDRIFNELGIDLINDPKEELEQFINYEAEQWHVKRLVKNLEQPVQLELSLQI